jgi:flagellar hook assembly protein FlgD
MAITQNRSTDLTRRQAFNGKGLTFIEVIFDNAITATATTPEALDSAFDKVTKVVNKNGTLLAASYRLAAKATVNDAAEVAAINANDSIDSYQYVVEGTPGQYNAADSAGDVNMEWDGTNDTTVIADAEADLETDILASLDVSDSAGNVHVKIRTLLPEGVANAGDDAIYGMFDQRGDA